MKRNKFIYALALFASVFTFQSCMDFDTPGDELKQNQKNLSLEVRRGLVDSINYRVKVSAEQVAAIKEKLSTELQAGLSGQYAMRGGKNGEKPGSHQYQQQYTLGADLYAQFGVIPHHDFPYSKAEVESSYAIQPRFYGGAMGSFKATADFMAPLLNHKSIDSIPELKSIYLLLFNYSAVEVANVYGPFPYQDLKTNKQEAPFIYNDLQTIYTKAVANIDSIVACLKYYETKPEDYQQAVGDILRENIRINTLMANTGTNSLDVWVRFANSMKLRYAMHLVKVDPELAKKWAEEAVKGGVIEETSQEMAVYPTLTGFTHPLVEISETWHDTRISASLESLLHSLNHPYLRYIFRKNDGAITNKKTNEVLEAGTRVVGIRAGAHTGEGQSAANNQYISFSGLENSGIYGMPLYLMKLSEVCFLRAEGALRDWDMGGTAQEFYEKGILNAQCDDRESPSVSPDEDQKGYKDLVEAYMAQDKATDYTYVDPTGETEPIKSVTKIGVKWNEGDSREVKLEKIITQKYIAAYPESFEAWVDLRRTGYPKLFDVLNVDDSDGSLQPGDIIRRLPFPGRTDPATKHDITATGLKALGGPDVVATRLWWDVNKGNF